MQGTYRIGFWYDPQDKEKFDSGRTSRDDMGLYLSFDQMVWKENNDPEDTQGVGLFARAGYTHEDVNEIRCFWSIGGQYQGLIPSRVDDVLGIGMARGNVSSEAGFSERHETVIEVYYNAAITPWLALSPSLQYIWHPGAVSNVGDACVIGIRAQMSF